jgi:hypothetical protein
MHVLSLSTVWENLAMPASPGMYGIPQNLQAIATLMLCDLHPGSARIGFSLMGGCNYPIEPVEESREEGNERGFLGV